MTGQLDHILTGGDQTWAWLAAIVDSTEDAVIGKALDGTIVSWNRSAERMYGYRADEAIGQSIALIFGPGREADVEKVLDKVARGEAVRRHDEVRIHKDGTKVHVSLSISPIRGRNGDVIGAASIATDMTAQRTAEERFRRLLLATPDAMVIVNAAGAITVVNQQTERLFGYDASELVGQPVEILVPERLRDRHVTHRHGYVGRPRLHGMGVGLALSGQRRDGSEFPIEVSLAPLDTDHGALISASIRDVTDRKRVELDLARARDEALAAAHSKSQFVAMVSHEIRTPMNGILGLTRLLLDTPLDPAQRRYAEAIGTSGSALLTIINDILDFSKIEFGRVELAESEFDLRRLIEEVVAVAAELRRGRHIEVVSYYPPELPTLVWGDGGRLRQALLNLVGNAVKFTEYGEVMISAEPAGDGSGHSGVTFAVADTGSGIAAEDIDHLFEPFSQLENVADRRFGGTGLGLTISRNLVELMGGRIDVESQPGQGSRFSFTVPLPAREHQPAEPAGREALAGCRLLIAEDNETSLRLMTDHARFWGMAPTGVTNCAAALDLLRAAVHDGRPYEVAVVDGDMRCDEASRGEARSGDHDSLADAILAEPSLRRQSLVVLTSGAYLAEQVAMRGGAVNVLPKPVGPSQLYDSLVGLLGPAGAGEARPGAAVQPGPATRNAPVGQGRLVLVAEDNEINQMVALGTLTTLGYRVHLANNGHEAVSLARSGQYSAVLMDCQMPEMNGFDATTELRRLEGTERHTPVIAMTAGVLAQDRERCLAVGMDDFVPKPIDPERLAEALRRWIPDPAPVGTPKAAIPVDAPDGSGDDEPGSAAAAIAARLELLRNGGPAQPGDLASRIVDAFVEKVPGQLDAIERAIDDGHAADVRTIAHELVSLTGNVGAADLCALSQRLQRCARDGDLGEATTLVRLMRHQFDRLLPILPS